MDINTKIKDFIKYANEVCLQNLFLADNIKVDLKNQDNLYEVERIEKEVISVYENIYLSLNEEFLLNLYKENKKAFKQLEETIEKMKKDANLKDGYIKNQIKKREELKETKNKLSKKWYYEIYGTTNREILLKAYNSQ